MKVLTELYRLSYDSLTFMRYKDENLGPIVRHSTGIVDPGFLLVLDNASSHVERVCR